MWSLAKAGDFVRYDQDVFVGFVFGLFAGGLVLFVNKMCCMVCFCLGEC